MAQFAQHNVGEGKLIIQLFLGIFIAYALTKFFSIYAINYSALGVIFAFCGLAIMYYCFRKNREFDFFVGFMCFIAIPFAIMYGFLN